MRRNNARQAGSKHFFVCRLFFSPLLLVYFIHQNRVFGWSFVYSFLAENERVPYRCCSKFFRAIRVTFVCLCVCATRVGLKLFHEKYVSEDNLFETQFQWFIFVIDQMKKDYKNQNQNISSLFLVIVLCWFGWLLKNAREKKRMKTSLPIKIRPAQTHSNSWWFAHLPKSSYEVNHIPVWVFLTDHCESVITIGRDTL